MLLERSPQGFPVLLEMRERYGRTTVAFRHSARKLLPFSSLYCTYAPCDAYSVIVRLVVRPVGVLSSSGSHGQRELLLLSLPLPSVPRPTTYAYMCCV